MNPSCSSTWRYKRKRLVLILQCAILVPLVPLVPLVNSAPLLSNYDIWGDSSNNKEVSNDVFSKNYVNSSSSFEKFPRVLNFFPVPFEEECLSNDRRRKGVCMNAYECRIQSGSHHGQCALGFGVCCVFTTTCDKEVFNNITYFVNPDFPDLSTGMTSCSVVVKKIDPEIAQIRLDFIHFNLGQPNRRTGICDDDVFVMAGGASKELKLCGLNSGQHAYFDVDNVNESIIINMNMGNKVLSRLWEVRIIQIPFSQRAPPGCLQYHIGSQGFIQTMNFAENGRHLAHQDYSVCMRQEVGMCSIAYEPCHENAFKIGPGSNNLMNGQTGGSNQPGTGIDPGTEDGDVGSGDGSARNMDICTDRIVMPCDSEDLLMPGDTGPGFCEMAHCGSSFCPMGESPCRIESSATPFTVGIQFGAAAKEESPEDNLGMCLKFEQLPCME